MRGKLLLLPLLLPSVPAHALKETPLLTGYVTAIAADGTFELDSGRILLQPGATFIRVEGKATVALATLPLPFLGEVFDCYGRFDAKSNTLLVTHLTQIVPTSAPIASRGIIEAVLPATAAASSIVRADGFLLHLPAAPALQLEDNLTPPTSHPTSGSPTKALSSPTAP